MLAALPNTLFMESGLLRDGAQERLVDGCYLLPEEPGLGGQSERAIAYASSILAILTERHGQYQRAIALNEETLALFREVEDQRGSAVTLQNQAQAAQAQEDNDRVA